MTIKELNNKNFNKMTSKEGIVMIDCWDEWGSNSHMFNPVYKNVAKKYSDYLFTQIEANNKKELVRDLGIKQFPTLMLYKDGVLLFKQPGFINKEKLTNILEQVQKIDMQEIRTYKSDKNNNDVTYN